MFRTLNVVELLLATVLAITVLVDMPTTRFFFVAAAPVMALVSAGGSRCGKTRRFGASCSLGTYAVAGI